MNIIFNSLNINNGVNYFVQENNHEIPAKQEINVQKIARTNESVILRKNFGIKTIKIKMIVKDSSMSALDSRLDTLKKTIEAKDKNLDMDYASGTRRYVCTGFIEDIKRNNIWAELTLRFECYQAFGENTSSTSETFAGKTTTPYTDDIEILGSAPAQPEITITINACSYTAGDKFIQIKNTDTGDYVKITASDFQADDVIVISTKKAIVIRNGTIMEYLGIMPEWIPGVNNWEYSDDFDTSRDIDIEFDYKKRYL